MKFYSLCFCLFLLLNFSPSFQSACEDVENPTGFSACQDKKTSESTETCCFNKYKDSDGSLTECVEISTSDAFDAEKLENAETKIEEGTYWDGVAGYDSVSLQCAFESECEKVDGPDGYSSCEGKSTETSSETCCYAKYTDYSGDDTECVDILTEDADDEDKLKAAAEKIKKGEYWDDYKGKYSKYEIECGSAFLKGIFVTLFAVFLF